MNRPERTIIGNIDRRRERETTRDKRTARTAALQARADAILGCAVLELPEADRADFCTSLATAVRIQLGIVMDAPGAASILSREAYEAARDILPRKIALARAEQLFTNAANDGGEK